MIEHFYFIQRWCPNRCSGTESDGDAGVYCLPQTPRLKSHRLIQFSVLPRTQKIFFFNMIDPQPLPSITFKIKWMAL